MTRTMYVSTMHTSRDRNGHFHCWDGITLAVSEPFTPQQEEAWADLSYRNSDEGWEGETPELEYMYEQAFGKRMYVTYTLA